MADEFINIQTNYGPVRGCKRKTCLGEDFYSFRGIPYAAPPVGDLRFKDPQPPTVWTEPIDATKEARPAIALEMFITNGLPNRVAPNSTEDCLIANVHTKDLTPRKPLPVLVWIHGGGFKVGSSSEMVYGPDYLLQKNIVFVSFNYRLGVMGFLSLNDPKVNVPGNAGLKDQTMALRWVRENIQHFGGDNKNITIFGESAGGCSVHFHLISNLSKGLFDKAISQSGTALASWANFPKTNAAEQLAKKLGWTSGAENLSDDGGAQQTSNDASIYEFLKNAKIDDIVLAQEDISHPHGLDGFSPFSPNTESYVSDQCFFDRDPVELSRTAWSTNVPVIFGGVANEGLIFYRSIKTQLERYQSIEWFERLLPKTDKCPRGSEKSIKLAKRIKQHYYGDEEITAANVIRSLQIRGEHSFWHGIQTSVLHRTSNSNVKASTYLYRFEIDSKILSHLKMLFAGEYIPGTCHGDDIMYLFKPMFANQPVFNSLEHKTISRMVDMWTQFAATGNPNGEELKNLIEWKPVLETTPPLNCLNINEELTYVTLPEAANLRFWDFIFAEIES